MKNTFKKIVIAGAFVLMPAVTDSVTVDAQVLEDGDRGHLSGNRGNSSITLETRRYYNPEHITTIVRRDNGVFNVILVNEQTGEIESSVTGVSRDYISSIEGSKSKVNWIWPLRNYNGERVMVMTRYYQSRNSNLCDYRVINKDTSEIFFEELNVSSILRHLEIQGMYSPPLR